MLIDIHDDDEARSTQRGIDDELVNTVSMQFSAGHIHQS